MFISLIIVLLGYLIGSIPTAYIFGCFSAGQDIRQMGDANMGAANAYRVLGARIGIAVYVIDVVKGALPLIIARWFDISQSYVFITGIATLAGHNWPIFLGFRGGRGESTTIGTLCRQYNSSPGYDDSDCVDPYYYEKRNCYVRFFVYHFTGSIMDAGSPFCHYCLRTCSSDYGSNNSLPAY